jgi:hypothetical protein
VVGVSATVLLLIQAITGSAELLPYSSAFESILYFYAAGALIAYMLADHVITRDVVPVKDFARSVVMLEQLAGLAYVAMVVSRLVGLLVMSRRGEGA